MANDKQTIISKIKSYVVSNGGDYSQWYIGVTGDARQRLFNDHAVAENGGAWIYELCTNSTVAREIEDYFLKLGMKGGTGGGDTTSRYAYAYKITQTTKE